MRSMVHQVLLACSLASLAEIVAIHPFSAAGEPPSSEGPASRAPAPPPALPSGAWGISHHFLHWEELQPLDPSWVRVNVHWGYFEPVPEPDTSRWAWQNDDSEHLQATLARGVSPLVVLRTGSVWANRGSASLPFEGPSYPPADLSETWDPAAGYSATYHRFVSTLVRHYNGDGVRRIPLLVIENEANSPTWWQGLAEGDPPEMAAEQYLRLLATAYHAAKEADPRILVAESGMASLAWGAAMTKELLDAGAPADSVLRRANLYFARSFNVTWGWPHHWEDHQALSHDFQVGWRDLVEETHTRVTTILAGLRPSDRWAPAEANVDFLNFHFYENHWVMAWVLEYLREKMGGVLPPLLTSELGSRSAAAPPPAWAPFYDPYGACGFDESLGAAHELVEKMVVALASGACLVNWFRLDGPGDRAATDKLELLLIGDDEPAGYPVLRHRPGYHAYAFLTRRLSRGRGYHSPQRDTCLAPTVYRYAFAEEGTGAPGLEILWWDDGRGQECGVGARGGALVELPPPRGARAARVYRDYLHPESCRLLPVTPGTPFLLEVNEHPLALEWEGLEGIGVGPPGCGRVVGEAPAGEEEDLGWQGLRVTPQPAVDHARIRFHLPRRAAARMTVYDVRGRERAVLLDEVVPPGWRSVRWDVRASGGGSFPPGLYLVALTAREEAGSPCGPTGPPETASAKIVVVR